MNKEVFNSIVEALRADYTSYVQQVEVLHDKFPEYSLYEIDALIPLTDFSEMQKSVEEYDAALNQVTLENYLDALREMVG